MRRLPEYRVATYRLRDSAETMEALVEDLAEVVRASSPAGEPVTLVAESFGGALAMSFAMTHRSAVSSLVVLNSFPRFHAPWQLHVAMGGLRVLPWTLTSRIRRVSARRHHSPSTPQPDAAHALSVTRLSTRTGYLNRLRILSRYDLRERLSQLSVPTLFLAADRDLLIPSVRHAHFMAAQVPGAQVRVLKGQGHACLLAPEVSVAGILEEWRMSITG
jgi:pimeloyl-ACP methyl ester carboxylesterase